ncbi:MAG TPA: methylated-DNA--[protein]-cysteine S-methyltransferase [Gammaproteobacteria bacterium]|nr:methylated-DNA--[protein]-cysteine S-methyltransferase [Gammaproteobacteria bacterium]
MAVSIKVLNEKICSLQPLLPSKAKFPSVPKKIQPIVDELHAYFKDPKHRFNLSLHIEGSPFQKSVWKALQDIPSGETLTYKDLAEKLKTSPRAIGNACRTNKIAIIIPCHRIVAKSSLGGYSGETKGQMLNMKSWLLQHEGYLLSS